MNNERVMLSFTVGAARFNYRVAAIALRDGHVLVCRQDDDDYVMLPGGRVEMGEPSQVALEREIAEELQSTAEIKRLAFTVENFFERHGQRFHELAAYYLIELPDGFPFRSNGVVLETRDEGHDLRFEWVPVEGGGLRERNLLPRWMIESLRELPEGTQHLVMHEVP
ncbi:MAG TPA: NUDIX domain-containing protein [Devosiaceae bacterium]|nr:NUDIX domain-containing protein [Devosiaceae bacterium]